MKTFKGQKGITLVALVITIIVLLILAVVAIGAVRDSGIIGHAQNSADKYNTGKADENAKLGEYEDAISQYETGVSFETSGKEEITKEVPIPSGFYYVIGKVDTGVVISDNPLDENNPQGKNGNQFVWVPVEEDISTTYYNSRYEYIEPKIIKGSSGKEYDVVEINLQIAECEDINKNGKLDSLDFNTELRNMYKAMADSVNEHNGFYVGRYETSINGTNPQSKYGEISAAAEKNSANTWYGLYALNKRYKTSSVQSSMMWGIQYDKMMEWMEEAADIDIKDKRNTTRTCGTAPYDVIKKVYDLGGNRYEWTIQANGELNRIYRGGADFNNRAPNVWDLAGPESTYDEYGSRLALFITGEYIKYIPTEDIEIEIPKEEPEIPKENLPETPDSIVGIYGDINSEEEPYCIFNKDYTGKFFNGYDEETFTFYIENDKNIIMMLDSGENLYEITFKVLKDASSNVINKFVMVDEKDDYDDTRAYTTNGSTGLQKLEDTRYKAYDGEELMGYFVFDGESVKANPIGTDEMIDIGVGDYFVFGNYIYVLEHNNVYWSAFRIEGDRLVGLGS